MTYEYSSIVRVHLGQSPKSVHRGPTRHKSVYARSATKKSVQCNDLNGQHFLASTSGPVYLAIRPANGNSRMVTSTFGKRAATAHSLHVTRGDSARVALRKYRFLACKSWPPGRSPPTVVSIHRLIPFGCWSLLTGSSSLFEHTAVQPAAKSTKTPSTKRAAPRRCCWLDPQDSSSARETSHPRNSPRHSFIFPTTKNTYIYGSPHAHMRTRAHVHTRTPDSACTHG